MKSDIHSPSWKNLHDGKSEFVEPIADNSIGHRILDRLATIIGKLAGYAISPLIVIVFLLLKNSRDYDSKLPDGSAVGPTCGYS